MALVIPEATASVALHFTLPGQSGDVVSTFGVTGFPDSDWPERIEAVVTGFTGNVLPLLQANVQLVEATWVANQDGTLIAGVTPVATSGANVASALPPNCTWLIKKNTLLAGRCHRGRMYLPGLVEANVDASGNLDGGQVTSMNGALQDWLDEVDGIGGATLVVLHDEDGACAAADPTPIASLICQGKIATQRKRLRD